MNGQETEMYCNVDLFELMVEAAIDGKISIQTLMDMCHEYGVADGKTINAKLEAAPSTSQDKSGMEVDIDENEVRKLISQESSRCNSPQNVKERNSLEPSDGSEKQMIVETTDTNEMGTFKRKKSLKKPVSDSFPDSSKDYISSSPNSKVNLRSSTLDRVKSDHYHGVYMLIPPETNQYTRTSRPRKLPTSSELPNNFLSYEARITLFEHEIELGQFASEHEAAIAHDRALMRAIGPKHCRSDELNFPVVYYASDPLHEFSQYDSVLKQGLFGSSEGCWNGPKDCDFSFLLTDPTIINVTMPTA